MVVDVALLFASSTRIQSPSPEEFRSGVENFLVPELLKGESDIATYVPSAGSYHRAVMVSENLLISTAIVRVVGMYMMANFPSGVMDAVT